MDLDVLLSYLFDNAPQLLETGSRAAIKQAVPGVASGLDYVTNKTDQIFAPMSFQDTEEDKARKAKIAEMFGAKEAEAAAANQPDTRQADLDAPEYDPAEYIRNYADNIGPDKLRAIKEEAFIKGNARDLSASVDGERPYGPQGQFRGGGTLSQAPESPEFTQRLAERDQWKEGQTLRDAEWEADLARQRRNQPGQELAGQKIVSLKEQASSDRRNQILEALVGQGGKIPFAKAEAARQLGLPIYGSMVGTDPEEASNYFQSLQKDAATYLSSVDPIEAMSNPNTKSIVRANRDLAMLAAQYEKSLRDGKDPDEALRKFKSEYMNYIMQNGLGNLVDIEAADAQAEAARQAQAGK